MPDPSVTQPPASVPVVDDRRYVTEAWLAFFSSLTSAPPTIQALTLTGSPFVFIASYPGNLLLMNGTITAITLTRARVTVTITGVTPGFIPVGLGDVVTITYAVAPDAWFVPF